MTRRSTRSDRASQALLRSLMLAPAVAALRVPLLAVEARNANPWRVETVRAVTEKSAAAVEGVLAAQVSIAWSVSRFWLEVAQGSPPSILSGVALERAVHAALRPSGKRVRTNYNRLKRGS